MLTIRRMRDPRQGHAVALTAEHAPPRISIVIPTRVGWPHMRASVDAVASQLADNDGELIVVDASGLPAPDVDELTNADRIAWISLPRTPSYALRGGGYSRARAGIVAVTEDHCVPTPSLLSDILSEHARAPDVAAIFGLVDNGSRRQRSDWALYSVGYLAWAPPAPLARGLPGHANLSFKSWVFDVLPPAGAEILEFRYVAALRELGYRVVATNRTSVTHFQSSNTRTTATLMFHNGRVIGGLRREAMGRGDWARLVAPGWVAAWRTARTLRLARQKPAIAAQVVRSAPLIAVLHLAHTVGECLGYLGGPGGSGRRVH